MKGESLVNLHVILRYNDITMQSRDTKSYLEILFKAVITPIGQYNYVRLYAPICHRPNNALD